MPRRLLPSASVYETKLWRFYEEQPVCLVHRSNHVQLGASLLAEYLQHSHHSKKKVLRSDDDAHIASRDYGWPLYQLPNGVAGNLKLARCYFREVPEATARRMGCGIL